MLGKLMIGAGVLMAAALLALAIIVFEPFKRIPDIGRGLPDRDGPASEELSARVKALFPLPMASSDIAAALAAQGFDISRDHNVASFGKNGFPCRSIWRVFWEVDDIGQATAIDAVYGGVCL